MTDSPVLKSKVLFYEEEGKYIEQLKSFFVSNNLVGLRLKHFDSLIDVIQTNINLGLVLLSLPSTESSHFFEVVIQLHNLRPELPIIIRTNDAEFLKDCDRRTQDAISAIYQGEDLETLKKHVDTHLFNLLFPETLIKGIEAMSEETLRMVLQGVEIFACTPFLIKDSVIYGELFSMIPLESNWCRGSMLLQVEKKAFANLIKNERTPFSHDDTSSNALNGLLGEITNMIWGRFKSQFILNDGQESGKVLSQVPIIIDQDNKYISFGSKNPQLCFRYVIYDKKDIFEPISLYQRFIFHLHWAPEDFKEPETVDIDKLIAGEIEFF
ncbi:chemotaxis protein CheX [Deltaproteobacteria bacterium TL4]